MPKFERPPRPRADTLSQALARNTRRLRRRKRLRQADLAFLAHLHPKAITGIESGTSNPTLATINALAMALGVDPVVLLNRNLYSKETIARQIATIEKDIPTDLDAAGAEKLGRGTDPKQATPRLTVVQPSDPPDT